MTTRVDFHGRLDGKRRTSQGGLRVDANLTRTGVFVYFDAKGQRVREYRPPSEVFKAESLDSLKLAPLTIGHPDMVRTDNFRDLNVGTVAENVRQRDQFVASDVLIQDQKTIDGIEDGSLVELSCGYEVDLVFTPGVTPEGEHYDAIQTNIVYNHVGLGGPGWGRAGSEVRLKLDGGVDVAPYAGPMSMTAEEKARLDTAEAERDAAKSELEKLRAKLDTVTAENRNMISKDKIPEIVAAEQAKKDARTSLEGSARAILGDEFKADGLTDEQVIAAALAKYEPALKIDGRSADYLRARFDAAAESAVKALGTTADLNAASSVPATGKTDATEQTKGPLELAIEEANAKAKLDAKAGPPRGARVRT